MAFRWNKLKSSHDASSSSSYSCSYSFSPSSCCSIDLRRCLNALHTHSAAVAAYSARHSQKSKEENGWFREPTKQARAAVIALIDGRLQVHWTGHRTAFNFIMHNTEYREQLSRRRRRRAIETSSERTIDGTKMTMTTATTPAPESLMEVSSNLAQSTIWMELVRIVQNWTIFRPFEALF